jgi:hypothetical protein
MYYIIFNKTFDSKIVAERELARINQMLRRLRKKKYPEVSFLAFRKLMEILPVSLNTEQGRLGVLRF